MKKKSDQVTDYESFIQWAHSLCQTIDTLENLIFEKDSPGHLFQERCVYAAKSFRDNVKENYHVINMQKTSSDFKRGFVFAMRGVIDILKRKDETYSSPQLINFIESFLHINCPLDNGKQ